MWSAEPELPGSHQELPRGILSPSSTECPWGGLVLRVVRGYSPEKSIASQDDHGGLCGGAVGKSGGGIAYIKSERHLGDAPLPPLTGCVVKRVLRKANVASTGIRLQGDLAVTL